MPSLIARLSQIYPKSLIVEFNTVFGAENTERLLEVFGGMTISIPSHEEQRRMKNHLDIYDALAKAAVYGKKEFKAVRKTIQAKYGMKKGKVLTIYKTMDKLHKKGREIRATDRDVSQHKKTRRK